jgi:hypothetical protein
VCKLFSCVFAAILVLALSAPAFAAPPTQNPAVADTLAPAIITNSIGLDKAKGPFEADGCRNYALEVMRKLKYENIQLSGGVSLFGIAALDGHRYVIGVRCETDNLLISLVVAGPDYKDAQAIMQSLYGTWSGN